ncbi:hypothetical protein PVK06_028891 [Gossypium arboreum]|uniref:Uncharacterized protein n=1 Tax=Gossypium arboreum TaxID=29729 RepID=A0ABR0P555_GOSAR|nr:hypothetical protein PVK06_028891 [Gossypium arboreum]
MVSTEGSADTICQDKVCIAKNNGNFVPRKKKKKQEEKVILWYLRFSAKRDFAVFTTVREAEIINDNSTKQIPFTGLILAGGLLTMLILWLRQTNQLKLTMLDAIMKSIQSAQFRLPIVRKQKVAASNFTITSFEEVKIGEKSTYTRIHSSLCVVVEQLEHIRTYRNSKMRNI